MRLRNKKSALLALIFIISLSSGVLAEGTTAEDKFKKSDAYDHSQKGVAYLNQNNAEQAIVEFEKAIEIFPDYCGVYSNLGYAYMRSNKPDKALESFKKALSLEPNFLQAVRGIAGTYMKLKQDNEAIEYFEKAAKLDRSDPSAYMGLGMIYKNKEQWDDAISYFKKVIEINPKIMVAHELLGFCYTVKKDFDAAYKQIKEAQALDPYNGELTKMADALENKINKDKMLNENAQKMSSFQEPKGDSMDLVPVTQKMLNLPFTINYPAKWYVREQNTDVPSLYISQEPIKNQGDKFKVGMSAFYREKYFLAQEPANSDMGKLAKAVIRIKDWSEDKRGFIDHLKKSGHTIVSEKDMIIVDRPAVRIEDENKENKMTIVYIKAGANLLMIIFETPLGEYEKYKDIFDSMINSISFKKDFSSDSAFEASLNKLKGMSK